MQDVAWVIKPRPSTCKARIANIKDNEGDFFSIIPQKIRQKGGGKNNKSNRAT